MKLMIDSTAPGLYRDDGVFAFVHRSADGETHVLELAESAQNELLLQLLSARMNKPRLNLFPKIVRAAPLDDGMVGVLLSLNESAGFYFGMSPQTAFELKTHLEAALSRREEANAA